MRHEAELTYSYSFWLKVAARNAGKTNIMQFTVGDASKIPTFSLDLKPGVTDVQFSVQQSDNPSQNCEAIGTGFTDSKPGFLELNKWVHMALTVEKFHSKSSKQILYVDGVKACEKDNTEGTTVDPEDNGLLFMSGPTTTAANAEIALMHFISGRVMTPAEVAVTKKIEQSSPVMQ